MWPDATRNEVRIRGVTDTLVCLCTAVRLQCVCVCVCVCVARAALCVCVCVCVLHVLHCAALPQGLHYTMQEKRLVHSEGGFGGVGGGGVAVIQLVV